MAFSIFQNMAKNKTANSWLPPTNEIAKASAFGAVLGVATSGFANYTRVKAGEINQEDAINETLGDGAKSAATMAAASVASHIVRTRPLIGFVALAAVGAGTFLMMKKAQEDALLHAASMERHTETQPDEAQNTVIEGEVENVSIEPSKPKRRRIRRAQTANAGNE
ncbi:hypothetical protein [Terasakiella sp.]|uniref:hypothetical protein n=1 Tax=Terasakiella sp. TaxID=2034861 RepID=UPI003AA870CE